MKPRDFKYFFKSGISGIMSNGLMSLASVSIVIASLFVLGIFIVLGVNLTEISGQIEKQCQINVFVPHNATDAQFKAVGEKLAKIEHVADVKYYTKEERYRDYKNQRYKDDADAISVFENDNPLRDSCVLSLDNPENAAKVIKAVGKVEGVEEVKNSLDLIDKIVSITGMIRTATIWIVLLLLVIAIFIISNTIKIGLFARRKEINIMKYVGATNWFIRWPFIVEGMLLGFIGSLFSSTFVLMAYEAIYPKMAGFFNSLSIVPLSGVYDYIVWWFMGIGVFIGMAGSYTSIRKYLKV